MQTPHWTAYLQALLTPVIAFFAVYVAASQWNTARNKLRLDLFEKRYAVYEAAQKFIGSIVTSGKVNNDNILTYMTATRAAKWIVSHEVGEYLERELYTPAIELQTLQSMLVGVPVGEERTKNVARQAALKTHFNAQYKQLDIWFSAYLQLSH
jgi:hypothetical protein